MKAEIGRLTGDVCDVVDCAWITGKAEVIRSRSPDVGTADSRDADCVLPSAKPVSGKYRALLRVRDSRTYAALLN
jgi:hypothetical protein